MDPFASDVLLKKVGSLQEKNDALSEESSRLRGTIDQKRKRFTFLVDKTHRANRRLRAALAATGAAAAALFLACVLLSLHASSLGRQNRVLAAKSERYRREQKVVAERMDRERQKLQGALETSKKENETLRYELQKAQLIADNVKEEKTYLEDILIHKTKEAEKLKAAVSEGAIKNRDEEIARLRDQNRLLAGKLEKLYKTSMDRLSAIGLAKSTLEETVADAKKRVDDEWNAVDLGSISVERGAAAVTPAEAARPAAEAAAAESKRAPRKEGRVRAVNEAHGFVVVDLGKVDELDENSTLQIKKGGEWIATLTVLEVRDVMAACTIKNAVPGYKIRIDDPVFIQQR